jgi:hypothetical protein
VVNAVAEILNTGQRPREALCKSEIAQMPTTIGSKNSKIPLKTNVGRNMRQTIAEPLT